MSIMRKASFSALALLLAATAAHAASYSVTLSNGTSFDTRYKPMTAEWDSNYAMLRTDQGNWIAIKKSEIVDVVSSVNASGFGYQIDDTTVFLGWSATEGLVDDAAAATLAAGAAGTTTTTTSTTAAPAQGGGGGGYTMQQFVSVPSSGVLPGGVPLGAGTSGGGTASGGAPPSAMPNAAVGGRPGS